jgi:hypothetical protein
MEESRKMKADSESRKFEKMARGLMAVPHAEIKAKLDAEKEAKRFVQKRKATHRRGA